MQLQQMVVSTIFGAWISDFSSHKVRIMDLKDCRKCYFFSLTTCHALGNSNNACTKTGYDMLPAGHVSTGCCVCKYLVFGIVFIQSIKSFIEFNL